ncbi:MAG: sulfite exporter TauE/SafE family protein [Sedimentisphaerales bacterium]
MIGQLSNPWWIFVLLGICAGTLSGLLGLGSGIILVPVLVLLCGFEQKSAQGMALAVMVPMALVGALRYWKNPEIDMNAAVIGLIILGALAGALAGTELVDRLPGHILQKVFAVVLLIVAVKMFVTSLKSEQGGLDGNLTNLRMVNSTQNGDVNNDTTKQ